VLAFQGRKVEELSVGYAVDVDVRTGAAALRVPVPAPPGRHGLAPALTLSYSSGEGNSAFGAGWRLAGLPTIGIDMRSHVPRWDGTDGYQLDGDELVPWLTEQDGVWTPRGFTQGEWSVAFLRSRRGSTRVRVERWAHTRTGRIHFRSRDAGNMVTVYGARPDAAARVADPDDEARTVAWLPELQIDSHGNALWIEYAAETLDGLDRTAPYERRRPSLAQRYLKRIYYSNVAPLVLDDALTGGAVPAGTRWCFQLVLDYGDHGDSEPPSAMPERAWPARADPFSSFHNGFEVRTYRLCRRFLAFHEFDELGPDPVPVGALVLTHAEDPSGSTLRQIARVGYRRDAGVMRSKALPPLRMTYAASTTDASFSEVPAVSQENVPAGLASRRHAFVDLFGEGLPGILTEEDHAWYYKSNLGGGRFGAQSMVLERPATRPGAFGFGDVDRDGDPDLSQLSGRLAGLYELDREADEWRSFRPFSAFPHVEALGGRAQWVDLNGDGRPDVVVSKGESFLWFASDGEAFLPPVEIPRPVGVEAVPTLTADPALDFFFADMTGNGLADLVRVRNGRVEYWPSLGNGRFADAIVMDDAPQFAPDDEFDAARLRFVDLDRRGTTDLVYLGRGEVTCWINAAGNRWVPGPHLTGLPYFDNVSSVRVLDFLGEGRACLVWSSPVPGLRSSLEYLQLAPSVQPGLLLSVDDSLGQESRLRYSSSVTHYLRDMASGRRWSTRLPEHHQVVDRLEVIDKIGKTRSVQRFEYHDGYYDGEEREARGFGQVDVYDADTVDATTADPAVAAVTAPMLSRTWFHLGTSMWNQHRPMGTYTGDPELPWLASHVVQDAEWMTADEIEDGLRALAGRMIRREVYAIDEYGAPGVHPFEVQQTTYRLRRLQPAYGRYQAAFSAVEAEDASWVYEQVAGDPCVRHQILVEADDYDLTRRDAVVAYARRDGHAHDVAAQGRHMIEVHDHGLLHVDEYDRFELAIPVEGKRFQLVGVRPGACGLFSGNQLRGPPVAQALAAPAPHHVDPPDDPALGPRARLLSWEQSFYWNDARDAPLPLGQVGELTLAHHEEAACFTPAFILDALTGRVDDQRLIVLGYLQRDGLWWQVDETHRFAPPEQFSQRVSLQRGDGAVTRFSYDAYALTTTAITDPLDNSVAAEIDYQQLAPWRLTDSNGNVSEVRYDALGVLVAATAYGHAGDHPWGLEPLSAIVARTPATVDDILADAGHYLQGAARYVWYDLDCWSRDGTPTTALTLAREDLVHDGAGGGGAKGRVQVSLAYLDGIGRLLQEKTLVEAGPAIQRDGAGNVVVDGHGQPVLAAASPRWRASGKVVYDAKQRPSRQYQPFFTASPAYENDDTLRNPGTSTLTRYDAVGRLIGQDFPNGTLRRVGFNAWSVEEADPNDTVLDSLYRSLREGLPPDDPERQAFEGAKAHAGTVHTTFLDPLGREAGSHAQGGPTAADRRTESQLDLEGRLRTIVDPRGLSAFSYRYDMQGRVAYQHSIDAEDLWTLTDAYDREVATWDSRGFAVERGYDAGDRPLYTDVRGGDGAALMDHRVEQWVYGESLADRADAARRNLLGRVVTVRDGASETSVDRYDPTGQVLAAGRRLRMDTDTEPDWRVAVPLESDTLNEAALFDALGRTRSDTLADGSVCTYEYLQSGALSRVRVTTPDGVLSDAPILDGITVSARGQRLTTSLGNGVQLQYGYDPDTDRLTTQTAIRDGRTLQRINYTHDPVGNIVRITDQAQEGANALISGVAVPARRDYLYDAHYRLHQASGRVHQALLQNDYIPGSPGTVKGTRHLTLNNGAAVERFTRKYDYDASGNLLYIQHVGRSQGWTTKLWISATSNRSLPAEDPNGAPIINPDSRFDANGNLSELSHLRRIEWNWRGSLARAVVIERPGATDDAERYSYGGDGLRVRRVTTRVVQGNLVEVTEQTFLGDAERKRISRGSQLILERWTLHVGDGDQHIALVQRWTKDDQRREVDDPSKPHVTYQLNTHQGSSAMELDETANLISYEEYFPYGGTAFIAGDKLREIQCKDYRYTGKEADDFTGLYYYGYRYYGPWMGRWLSPDPIGPGDDLNLYQFVFGDPVGNVDTTGLDASPGEVVWVNRVPPKRAETKEGKIAAYRAALSRDYQKAFDSLTLREKRTLVREESDQWLVPKDSRADTGTTGWIVISEEQYKNVWLPARQEWARETKHTHVRVTVFSENPNALPGRGQGEPRKKADEGVPTATEAKATDEGGKTSKDAGDGGGKGRTEKERAGDGETRTATGQDQGEGRGRGDAGKGGKPATGGGGSDGRGLRGTGQYRGPGGPALRGIGQQLSDVYGNELGGMRGGQSNGVLGGTPFSHGHTPGGQGNLPEGVAGGGQHSGRSGATTSQGVAGAGVPGPSESGKGAPPGVGDNRRLTHRVPGASPGTGPANGSDATSGQGPTGAGQDAQGRPGTYGWKNVLLDIAGMTNFVFDRDADGDEGGVPGGSGPFRLKGEFWQWLYIGTSIISFIDFLFGIGELVESIVAAARGLYKLGRYLITELPNLVRLGWRSLARGFEALSGVARGIGKRLVAAAGRGAEAAPAAAGTAKAVASAVRRSRRLQSRFMRQALRRILADKSHPLRFLVDPVKERWLARSHLSELPTVQAGHLVSFHSGAAEALALEDAFFNQVSNWKGERLGAVFKKVAVEIGGIPVEVRTAKIWESIGALAKGTVERAARTAGWTGLP
jgi:RHS repeat-associated protein